MSGTPFKTPALKMSTKKQRRDTPYKVPSTTNNNPTDDSEDNKSVSSESSNGDQEMSLITYYDDLYRTVRQALEDKKRLEESYINTVDEMKLMLNHCQNFKEECQRLQELLSNKVQENTELERSLKRARDMLDQEKRKRKQAQHDLEEQLAKISVVMNTLGRGSANVHEIKKQLATLHPCGRRSLDQELSTIPESNTTGSILSDFSLSQSEDDLDCSVFKSGNGWRKMKPTEVPIEEPAKKKRRTVDEKPIQIGPNESVRATTTVTVTKDGPIQATSVIESVLPENIDNNNIRPQLVVMDWDKLTFDSPKTNVNSHQRHHSFQSKIVVMMETCPVCEKRLRFGKSASRCKECKTYCHNDCKHLLPLPCIPVVNTPNFKKAPGSISDYTPATPPMVPALMVICINEIERRGMQEIGIYRIPGSEKEVKSLKERLLTSRGPVNLKDVEIHVICCCIKDFLRSLTEPLVTCSRCKDFIEAVNAKDEQDIVAVLCQSISELPQPNRESLAYLILHLQRVGQSQECKMPIENLAKIFGPTIIGYTSDDLNNTQLIQETRNSIKVMEWFLRMPSNYWNSLIEIHYKIGGGLQQTPSTDSLLRTGIGKITTPKYEKPKKRIFTTPPTFKNNNY